MTLPLIIEADELKKNLDNPDLLIIDLSSEENYLKGHIPSAIHLPASRLLRGETPVPNKLPSKEQLEQLCADIGLQENSIVVAYDDQMGPWAGRLMWTLNVLGHNNCSVLNGQLAAWVNAGFKLEQQSNSRTAVARKVTINNGLIADVRYIQEHLGQSNFTIWDARSADEHRGEKVINAQKGGHIPGAKHLEWSDCLISSEDLRLKPDTELQTLLTAAGINKTDTVVTHCQTHRRSGLTYLIARHLGFDDIRCYDGSWFEWGNLPDTPVEK